MSATAFNRSRRQAEALADAKARDDVAQNTPLNHKLDAEALAEFSRSDPANMASPPYPDLARLINIPADANLQREAEAMKQAELNKTRILSDEAREELQNSHWRDDKTKAIPDHDEAGQDRSQFGMAPLQDEAYADYQDPRSPYRDGRLRAAEPYDKRPDADTTESKASRQKATPLVPDDDPKEIGAIIERGNAKAMKKAEDAAAVVLVPATDDPKEAKVKGASKFAEAPPKAEVSEEPPAPAHTADPDMIPAPSPSEPPAPPPAPPPEPEPAPEPVAEPPAEQQPPSPPAEEPKATRGRPKKS
jgi:hypothetical protein